MNFCRCLKETDGFSMTPRDRSYLPAEFPKDIPGTCYFLDSYKHEAVPEDAPQHLHIEQALKDLGMVTATEDVT